jgi:hypothetical protein
VKRGEEERTSQRTTNNLNDEKEGKVSEIKKKGVG